MVIRIKSVEFTEYGTLKLVGKATARIELELENKGIRVNGITEIPVVEEEFKQQSIKVIEEYLRMKLS